jgi:tetrathionate reductase subunit B
VDKCDFCEGRRTRGELPACVVTCPTKARNFGNIHDPDSEVARQLKRKDTVRIINRESDTLPNIYYLSATAPIDWPVKAKMPAAIQTWKLINPLIWAVVGLNAFGVLVMLGKQLLVKEDEPEIEHEAESEGPN